MIAAETRPKQSVHSWQLGFVELLPELEQRLRSAFRQLDHAARAEAVAEAVALSAVEFSRLHARGRSQFATASTLSFYSCRQVKSGRMAASRLNSKEPLSRYSRLRRQFNRRPSHWIDTLTDNKNCSIADQVALRLDTRQWLKTLTSRVRRIAKDLAFGCSTSEVAIRYGLSRGRISQLRAELHAAWKAFQGEAATS